MHMSKDVRAGAQLCVFGGGRVKNSGKWLVKGAKDESDNASFVLRKVYLLSC